MILKPSRSPELRERDRLGSGTGSGRGISRSIELKPVVLHVSRRQEANLLVGPQNGHRVPELPRPLPGGRLDLAAHSCSILVLCLVLGTDHDLDVAPIHGVVPDIRQSLCNALINAFKKGDNL